MTSRTPHGHRQAPVRVHLPIDVPPRVTHLPAPVLEGLSWEANQGTTESHIGRPWAPYVAPQHFPQVLPSSVGPAAIRPVYGFSINTFSPSRHRGAGVLMEHRPALPLTRRVAPRAAAGPRRVRGQVMPSPAVDPKWRNAFTGRFGS